ncbi:hypothetical protein Tco_0654496 [Tanacetum coccineum]|uniref:Transposase (Putative), gypsy type n=1 Tax=Tanacetum coccineum TaxID=301880 RepID=A0ABQ4X3K7_9ASTR
MDLYHSRLTQDDLNDLIIKYKIPRDLHPSLPSKEFVMSELPDDAIVINHRMFDFSGVRIPFSSFLLALIKHYRVQFSQLGPVGLNKVIGFHLPSAVPLLWSVSCIKHWKSGFFLIIRRAILNVMVWRHPDAAIDDPRPAAGSFNMADVRRLSAHVVKLRDMLEGADGNVMSIHDFLCLLEWTGAEIVARLKLLPEGIRLYFGAALSHVAKLTRSALAQSSGSTNRPSLFVGDSDDESDGDDDACVEIPLVTPLRSATVIHPSGNQGRSSTAPAAEGSNARDSRVLTKEVFNDPDVFKTIVDQFPTQGEMVRVESLSDDPLTAKMSVLHCMMMSHGGELLARYRGLNQSHHEYVLSTDSRLKGYEEKVASLTGLELQVSTLKKQVSGLNDNLATSDASFAKSKAKGKERKKKMKSLTKSLDNLHSEVARLSAALNQATILEVKRDEEIMRLKATPPEFSSFFWGQFQGLVRKFLASDEFSRVQGELLSLAASAGFERGLSIHRTKDEFVVILKKMVNFMLGAHDRLVEASPLVAQTDCAFLNKISEHATEPLSVILQLEPEKLARSANVLIPRDTRASPPIAKESTATPGVSRILDDVIEVAAVELERVSSGPIDVVVALFVDGKGNVLIPSSVAGEEVVINSFGV